MAAVVDSSELRNSTHQLSRVVIELLIEDSIEMLFEDDASE